MASIRFDNRGKAAEKLLREYMESLCIRVDTVCTRLPDAHAGSLTATLCDFLFFKSGTLHLVECKSTKHNYRLPHANVDASQIAKMRLWKFAGAKAFVMVYHETLGLWRFEDVDFFVDRSTGGSWDFRSRQESRPLAEVFDEAISRSLNADSSK